MLKRSFEGGVRVSKGDIILKLENSQLQMNYISQQTTTNRLKNEIEVSNNTLQQSLFRSKAQVIEIDFNIDEARDRLMRNEQLWKDRVISEQDYLDSKRRFNRLKASRENILKQMEFDSITIVTQVKNRINLG